MGTRGRRSGQARRQLPAGATPGKPGRLDGGIARDFESRRNDYEGLVAGTTPCADRRGDQRRQTDSLRGSSTARGVCLLAFHRLATEKHPMNCQFHQCAARIRCRFRGAGFSAIAASASAPLRWRNCFKPRVWRAAASAAAHRRSARAEKAAASGQGQAGGLSLHGRGAEPFGIVRLQTAIGPVQRHAAAARTARRLPRRLHQPDARLLGPKFKFARHGKCGAELSELLPGLAEVVDQIAIVKSMMTDAFNHAPRTNSDEHRLAAIRPAQLRRLDHLRPGERIARSARLRRAQFRQEGDQRRQLEFRQRLLADGLQRRAVPQRRRTGARISRTRAASMPPCSATRSMPSNRSNQQRLDLVGDPEIATRINSFEMAYRMQSSAPELADLSQGAEGDSRHVRRRAGQAVVRQQLPDGPPAAGARRAVRAIVPRSVGPARQPDARPARRTAKTPIGPAAALVKDLKQRGLLDDTIVLWGGEFGRTPMAEGGNDGRDHHPNAFTYWMAGGGIKPGLTLGRTDDFGFNVVEDRVHVHDLARHALAPAGLRPHEADLPLPRPRLPPHRRRRHGGQKAAGVGRSPCFIPLDFLPQSCRSTNTPAKSAAMNLSCWSAMQSRRRVRAAEPFGSKSASASRQAHTKSSASLPICDSPSSGGCGLPQCGMGGCGM